MNVYLQYESGEGNRYVSRKAALKMLQLSLKDFRKLCILKGIYPREPRNRKRAQKGATGIKTLYHLKDIQFLMHEPIIWKLRDYKVCRSMYKVNLYCNCLQHHFICSWLLIHLGVLL